MPERHEQSWNAENRLAAAEKSDSRLEFKYDYIGRRIQKQVYAWDAASDLWSLTSDLRYVYDGWNLIEILDATSSDAVVKTYTWGLDLSQSLQGAGGVGGLLAVTEHGETADTPYYTTYDANGNISEYLDNTGSVAVHYEYSPFGRLTLVDSETGAPDFNHRFSTKYRDVETKLYYYGSRYYSPELGRWMNRDPSGEVGGNNLHGFVKNGPLVRWDLLGLSSYDSVLNRYLFYTWHMGWIDKSHAYGKNASLVAAWKDLKAATDGAEVNFSLSMSQGSGRLTNKESCAEFCVNAKATEKAKKQQLLCAWKRISMQFEEYQGKGIQGSGFANRLFGSFKGEIDKKPSGFSSEDLVSNLVMFYAIVDGTSADALVRKHAGIAYFEDGKYAANLTLDLSIGVWQLHPVRPDWKKWTPDYPDYKEFIERDLSDLGENPLVRTQAIFQELLKKYGPPKFPAYFQKYEADCDGVTVKSETNTGRKK